MSRPCGQGLRVTEALAQIAVIHGVMVRVEVYRGFRSFPIALSGLCGGLAAFVQDWGWRPRATAGPELVLYWFVVAILSAVVGTSEVAYHYWARDRDDPFARRKTRRVLGQFLPCLVLGCIVTGLVGYHQQGIVILPGLWAGLFALGIFAARPYLPRAIGWVGLLYLIMGCALLHDGLSRGLTLDHFPGWQVGMPFALGQSLAALVLYWNLERGGDHGPEITP